MMRPSFSGLRWRSHFAPAALFFVVPCLAAQSLEERVEALERKNRELEATLEAFDTELERVQLGDLVPRVGDSRYGLGPAASKVYSIEDGFSIGGYGEFLFRQISGATDVADAQRAITYIGYRFDEKFVLNTEIEIEHGTTGGNSGTTGSRGTVSLEFGYLDYLARPEFNLRAGLLLPPMGWINELHEPTTFLSARRPQSERSIIPSTWRALGAGAFGDVGDFSYRAYLVNSLDGEDFGAGGLRGGRQSGNRAAVNDVAGVVRVDYTGINGATLGVAVFHGDTGQDHLSGTDRIPALDTTIVDAHAEFRDGPWWLRGLYTSAWVDDVSEFNAATGESLAHRLEGFYGEVAYDVMTMFDGDSTQQLFPFVRYERIDTQAKVARGAVADRSRRDDITTFGLHYKPIPQIVLKTDYENRNRGADSFQILLGYIF